MIDLIRGTRNLAGATLLALSVAAPATAAPILWKLPGVAFSDGGTASGSFMYDADLNIYSSVDITTTPGTVRNGAHFTQSAPFFAHSSTQALFLEDGTGADATGAIYLFLRFSPLTNAGGIGDLVVGEEGVCGNAPCSSVTSDEGRFLGVIPGALVAESAVTEPTSMAILGAALLGIGALRNRRR